MALRSLGMRVVRRIARQLRDSAAHAGRPSVAGFLDYYAVPANRDIWGGPLNGQIFRQQLFRDLVEALKPDAIVETGTFRGVTTEFLATTSGRPVYTVEYDGTNFGFAAARLRHLPSVHRVHGDSRMALRQWLSARTSRDVLIAYLDAHWREELPARDEVRLIFERCPLSVVMIDDFEVPDDPGYGFDDYGPGKTLNLPYLDEEIARFGLRCFFPACPSALETGARRGCIVLASADQAAVVATLARLRPWNPGPK
jgi:hypothetical protein